MYYIPIFLGWWQYDERTCSELESAYKRSQRLCELLIAGFLYVIDFDQMLQYRKTDLSRRRRIKRDLASIPKKGVAGLRMEQSEAANNNIEADTSTLDLLSVAASRAALNSNSCLIPNQIMTPQTPSNTPQTPQTPRSPPSPAPGAHQGCATLPSSRQSTEDWRERQSRRLRRAMEEIERLRLHDGDNLHRPEDTTNAIIYYNLEEPDLVENTDPWPSEDSFSEDEDNHN